MLKTKINEKYEIFAMANLSSKTTGVVGAIIWVSAGEFEGKKSVHGARIKVVEGTNMTAKGLTDAAVVTIADVPELKHGKLKKKTFKLVAAFITLNKAALLSYWKGKIDTSELTAQLKPVS